MPNIIHIIKIHGEYAMRGAFTTTALTLILLIGAHSAHAAAGVYTIAPGGTLIKLYTPVQTLNNGASSPRTNGPGMYDFNQFPTIAPTNTESTPTYTTPRKHKIIHRHRHIQRPPAECTPPINTTTPTPVTTPTPPPHAPSTSIHTSTAAPITQTQKPTTHSGIPLAPNPNEITSPPPITHEIPTPTTIAPNTNNTPTGFPTAPQDEQTTPTGFPTAPTNTTNTPNSFPTPPATNTSNELPTNQNTTTNTPNGFPTPPTTTNTPNEFPTPPSSPTPNDGFPTPPSNASP